jgi:hypothetical protein
MCEGGFKSESRRKGVEVEVKQEMVIIRREKRII